MASQTYRLRRRGVSPIIATLMLVAIAVVGGVVVYTYFSNISNKTQIQQATLHATQLLGYDARQINPITNHLGAGISGANNATSITYIALYIKNSGAQQMEINRVYVNGAALTFNSGALNAGQFHIGSTTASGVNTLNTGSTDTLLLRLSSAVTSGTNLTVVVEVTGGQQFKYDIVAGNRVF
jgi:flagellin-like protein